MRAFKFRGGDQFGFILDIINHQRLYCSDLASLNDPSEGMIDDVYWGRYSRVRRQTRDRMALMRICSFSLNIHNLLLWAHYASGLRGVAIEVDLPEPFTEPCRSLSDAPVVIAMDYGQSITTRYEGQPIDSVVFNRLCRKLGSWAYENEVRLVATADQLEDGHFYRLSTPIQSVTVGLRMPDEFKTQLFDLCQSKSIPLFTAHADSTGVTVSGVSEHRALNGGIWEDERGVSHFEPMISFSDGPPTPAPPIICYKGSVKEEFDGIWYSCEYTIESFRRIRIVSPHIIANGINGLRVTLRLQDGKIREGHGGAYGGVTLNLPIRDYA